MDSFKKDLFSPAFGIDASTAMFGSIETLRLEPLRVAEPRASSISTAPIRAASGACYFYWNYGDQRDRNDVFDGLVAARYATLFSSERRSERISGEAALIMA